MKNYISISTQLKEKFRTLNLIITKTAKPDLFLINNELKNIVSSINNNNSEIIIQLKKKLNFDNLVKFITLILESESQINLNLKNIFEIASLTDNQKIVSAISLAISNCNKVKLNLKTNTSPITEIKVNLIVDSNEIDNAELLEIINFENIICTEKIRIQRLQDLSPDRLTPSLFAIQTKMRVEEINSKYPNIISMTILDNEEAKKERLNLYLSIACGSRNPAKFIYLEYNGDPFINQSKLALIGKGITFDSGGYSKKLPDYMREMKFDMSGAAIAIGTLLAAAEARLKVNLVAIAPTTENTITSKSILPDSIITSRSGLTVEIENTDAEGRLVLADAISFAKEKFKVEEIIELSTLTGAIIITLGKEIVGSFTNSALLEKELQAAATITGEQIHNLPLTELQIKRMKLSKIADVKNMHPDGSGANSSHAAAFLKIFAQSTPFVHLDIAGTAWNNGRGTAIMFRTLTQLLKTRSKKTT